MPTRTFDDQSLYREYIREYLATAKNPTYLAAYDYVCDRCREESIEPPHEKTVSKIMRAMGYTMKLVKE